MYIVDPAYMMLHLPPPWPAPAPVMLYLALLLLIPEARDRPDITLRPRIVSNIGLLRNWAALSSLSSLSRVEKSCDREVLLRNKKIESIIEWSGYYACD